MCESVGGELHRVGLERGRTGGLLTFVRGFGEAVAGLPVVVVFHVITAVDVAVPFVDQLLELVLGDVCRNFDHLCVLDPGQGSQANTNTLGGPAHCCISR